MYKLKNKSSKNKFFINKKPINFEKMEFNINDFSGIQNDESQFMDQSNVNINVFDANSPQRIS